MTSLFLREHISLLEALQYTQLLNEDARMDFLVKTYGQKIADKYFHGGQEPEQVDRVIQGYGLDIGPAVIQYIAQHDPTRNKAYTQWMVVRYLKNALKLEDLGRAQSYLAVFTQARARIEKKDINQYKSLPELFQAVQPFIEGGQAVSNRAEDDAEAKAMAQQSMLVHDDANLKVVIPLTQAASIYFGRNTQWCTAATDSENLFAYYARQGSLYIILFKKENKRFQFHFETGQFMDETDSEINLEDFITEHPEIISIIGTDEFIKVCDEIGLRWFTPEQIFNAKFDVHKIVAGCKTTEDFLTVPETMRKTLMLVPSIVKRFPTRIRIIPDRYLAPWIDHILKEKPEAFRSLPHKFQTTETALKIYKKYRSRQLQMMIPVDIWNDEITEWYWATQAEDHELHLDAVPEEYRHAAAYVCFRRYPNDMEGFPQYLNEAMVMKLLEETRWQPAYVFHLPDEYKTDDLFDKAWAHFNRQVEQGWGRMDAAAVLSEFDPKLWNYDVAKLIVTYEDVPPEKLSDRLMADPGVMVAYLRRMRPSTALEFMPGIPEKYLTPYVITQGLTDENYENIPKHLLTPEIVLQALQSGRIEDVSEMDIFLPDHCLTPQVRAALKKAYQRQKQG